MPNARESSWNTRVDERYGRAWLMRRAPGQCRTTSDPGAIASDPDRRRWPVVAGAPQTAGLTVLALVAFAANSVLCRAALGPDRIDPASFSALRLLSGAAMLWMLVAVRRPQPASQAYRRHGLGGSWFSAACLFSYAVPFSFAYQRLATGTGALILFGAVQATMLLVAIVSGERLTRWQGTGLAAALGGVAYLVLPGISAPSPVGASLMGVAGIAWGLYSLRGRVAHDPLDHTAGNFVRSLPLVAVVSATSAGAMHVDVMGATLAVASGAIASGGGYAIWYAALPRLTATAAAAVQLAVPLLAAGGGIVFMAEAITPRLVVASGLILGGVALALRAR